MSLVERMNGTLSFVEDVEMLKIKLKNFTNTIELALQEIEECSGFIRSYMSANTTGMYNNK